MSEVRIVEPSVPEPLRRIRRKLGNTILPYVLITPLLIFIVALSLYPTLMTFTESFISDNLLNPIHKFIGFGNYVHSINNPIVMYTAFNTVIYMIIGVVLSTVLAVIIGLAIWRKFPGRGIVLGLLILPWALPGITSGIIWSWIYDPTFGVLDSALKSLHIISHFHLWISGNRWASIFWIELTQIWQITPLASILVLASLQSIPQELLDAASVDGCGKWMATWRITLPLIRPGVAIAVVQCLIGSMNIFDQVYVLNGAATTAASIMMQTYTLTFVNLDFGQGYALSFVMVLVTMLFSVGALKLIYRKVEY